MYNMIDIFDFLGYNKSNQFKRAFSIFDIWKSGALAQLGAHNTGSVGVRGSNPISSAIKEQLLWYNKL